MKWNASDKEEESAHCIPFFNCSAAELCGTHCSYLHCDTGLPSGAVTLGQMLTFLPCVGTDGGSDKRAVDNDQLCANCRDPIMTSLRLI